MITFFTFLLQRSKYFFKGYMTIQIRTTQILKKYLKDYISKSIISMKKIKNAYVDLINIYKPLLSSLKICNIFKDMSKIQKITIFFTLIKPYFKKYLIFCKLK